MSNARGISAEMAGAMPTSYNSDPGLDSIVDNISLPKDSDIVVISTEMAGAIAY